jgi:hypothetical protein
VPLTAHIMSAVFRPAPSEAYVWPA